MFGGIGTVCYDLAYSLSKKRIRTTVICGRSQNNKVCIEKPNSHLEIIRLPFFDVPPRFLWFQLQNMRVFREFLKDQTIIHVVNPQAGAICAYLKKKLTGKYLITSIHGVPIVESKVFLNSPANSWTTGELGFNLLEYPLNHYFIKVCLANSDRIVVCSNATLNDMKIVYGNMLRDNISVIYNGINFEKIESIKPDSESHADCALKIIYYGRLYWRKGIWHLIRAVANLKQRFSGFNLEVFGRGPLENKIRQLILSRGLKDIVHLRGHVPYEELVKKIKMSDIVIVPSLYEAQSVSTLEAMACKKPVVAFDFPFAREVIVDMHNGLLARPGDADDLSSKMGLLLSDKSLRKRLGENAYEHVRKEHDWETIVEKYAALYENLTYSKN
jgi:glycosyltransferase involved in cell wall biosynthesis